MLHEFILYAVPPPGLLLFVDRPGGRV